MTALLERIEQAPAATAVRPEASTPEQASHAIRFLVPGEFDVQLREDGVLQLVDLARRAEDGTPTRHEGVRVHRALPLSDAHRFVSLRAGHPKEVEIGIIRDMAEIDARIRGLLEKALARRYLIHTVRQIVALKEEFGFLTWTVETERGQRQFTMPRWDQTRVQEYGPDGISRMVFDAFWNRYMIPDLGALDSKSRKLFFRYIYW